MATSGKALRALGGLGTATDDRFGGTRFGRKALRKLFPDHWTFLLGEIAMYSFFILIATGVFLTLFFKPSMTEVVYNGSYTKMRGVEMSEAYASTLGISFDVRGGLLMRQIHHWAAILFAAAVLVHMLRNFFTGAFRKPRELNWLIGIVLLILVILEGLFGYSLPDDMLSGTGIRILQGVILALPVVGTYLAFFVFGGEFPGDIFIPRLYVVHILLLPAIMLALILLHAVVLTWRQTHTQYPGPGRTSRNVVGRPFFPTFIVKTTAFFIFTFGVLALLSALFQINPVWMFGPYRPSDITAGSQPDFYMGFLEGALRMMPAWEINLWGYPLALSVLVPALVVPGVLFTGLAVYPFVERWVTGDHGVHHLLDRPRDVPARTGVGIGGVVFYGVLWLAGANDILARMTEIPLFATTWFFRVAIIVGPVAGFLVARRICLGLLRRERAMLEHGVETGIIRRLPNGEYVETERPVSEEIAAVLRARRPAVPLEAQPPTEGVPPPEERGRLSRGVLRLRLALNRAYHSDEVALPPMVESERERPEIGPDRHT
jgi:quinol-cytochrome oxidoreductase complex cytochrome b subunit